MLVMAIACLFTVLLASPATFEVELGRDANVRTAISSDGSHLDVEVVTAGESVRLRELVVPPAVTGNVEQIGKRHLWLTFSTDQSFTSALVRLGNKTTLVVTLADREEALMRRLLERTPELGGALSIAHGLRPAENAIVVQRFGDAAKLLGKIGEGAPAHAWALLRASDVNILTGERELGCRGYAEVVNRYHERSVSLVARLRAVGFGCVAAEDADWVGMLQTIKGLDGALGVWVGREAALVMQTLATSKGVDAAAVAVGRVSGGPLRPNMPSFRESLTSRAVATRRKSAVELATWVTDNGERVVKHVDAPMMRLETARALTQIDLNERAIAVLSPMMSGAIPRPDAPLGVWAVLTDAYASTGDVNALTALSAAFALATHDRLEVPQVVSSKPSASVQEIDDVFASLERRLQRLRRHLGKEAP